MSDRFSLASGLQCAECSERFELGPLVEGCPACGAQLEVTYDHGNFAKESWADPGCPGIWRFHDLLPLASAEHIVSLGEGGSPLVLLPNVGVTGAKVWAKLEGHNPTGSFKDRLNSVVASTAALFGKPPLVASSTGNHGVSLAAYGARLGSSTAVLLDSGASELTLNEIRYFGATPFVAGGTIDTLGLMAKLWRDHDWLPSIRNFPRPPERRVANPFGIEGYKTIAYEIVEDLGGRAPESVFVPAGGGDGISGIWRGFVDLYKTDQIADLPRLYACQAAAACSLVAAYETEAREVATVEAGPSIALSIIDGRSGDHGLRAVRDSGGAAIAISDEEIREAIEIGSRNGIFMDPASAASIAGYLKFSAAAQSPPSTAVCVITASGYRWPNALGPAAASTCENVWDDPDAIIAALAQ